MAGSRQQLMNAPSDRQKQIHMYQCGICTDFEFEKRYLCERHMLEQHSGYGVKCSMCKGIFNRPDNHKKKCEGCEMSLVCRRTGTYTNIEKQEYEAFHRNMPMLVNRVQRAPARTPTEKQIRNKENRSRSHKRISSTIQGSIKRARTQSPRPVLKNLHQNDPQVISEPATATTQKSTNQSIYRPQTCPISPATIPKDSSYSTKYHPTPLNCLDPPVPKITKPSNLSETSTISGECLSILVNDSQIDQEEELLQAVDSILPRQNTYSPSKTTSKLSSSSSSSSSAEPSDQVPGYEPTPIQTIRLKGLALAQKQRLFLNVGGTKFETSVPTLQADPSSLLAHMITPKSALKPYSVDNVYTYFLDRDPKPFGIILNYLRNGAEIPVEMLPSTMSQIRCLQKEAEFFNSKHLELLCEKKYLSMISPSASTGPEK